MKSMMIFYCIIIMSACQMSNMPSIPELLIGKEYAPIVEEEVQVQETQPDLVEYEYTIIGTWQREFDGHVEQYVYTSEYLSTFCDGIQNGSYHIEYTEDWTFILLDTVFDYELLHGAEMDVLILGGYSYVRMD